MASAAQSGAGQRRCRWWREPPGPQLRLPAYCSMHAVGCKPRFASSTVSPDPCRVRDTINGHPPPGALRNAGSPSGRMAGRAPAARCAYQSGTGIPDALYHVRVILSGSGSLSEDFRAGRGPECPVAATLPRRAAPSRITSADGTRGMGQACRRERPWQDATPHEPAGRGAARAPLRPERGLAAHQRGPRRRRRPARRG